jgi:RNA polymerase sigma-70 factor (ECF subfamily)
MAGRRPLRQSLSDAPDERLLIEAAQRDRTRFADLYELYFDRVYAYIARRVFDRSDAEDLTSEVFHHALANLGRFEWRGAPFAAWLFRIAANAIADRSERLARERKIEPPPESQEADQEEILDQARAFQLVRELPDDQRRVVEMRFAEQKSIKEIAGELGRTEGAVKQLQFRGLENLRARIGGGNG